ncbi:MAG: hypothetical protein HY881_20270 [Deltaproteobacteria bacterium]|nr:hypothetical protein [Deltaproteobacteria bacterium]
MRSQKTSQIKTVRRSVAIPRQLIEEIHRVAPPELEGNFNRLVITALRDYSARRKKESFEKEMAQMAADPDIRCILADISSEFTRAEYDGLSDD